MRMRMDVGSQSMVEHGRPFQRSWFARLLVGSLAVASPGCDMTGEEAGDAEPATIESMSGAQGPSFEEAAINDALDSTARLLAHALGDPALRQQVRELAAERFTGDTEVLYETLDASLDMRGKLAGAYELVAGSGDVRASDALSAVDDLTGSIPRLQVAVRGDLDAWDAREQALLVGSTPVGIDDLSLETITAYDAGGQAHELDAQVAPDEPVIIVGVSERTDDAGQLRTDLLLGGEAADDGGPIEALGTYEVRLISLALWKTNEGAYQGSPEIKLVAHGGGVHRHIGLTDANAIGVLYTFNRSLGSTSGDVIFYWYEDDSSAQDFPLKYDNVSLGVTIAEADDYMGAIRLPNSSFAGGSDSYKNLGELGMTTD